MKLSLRSFLALTLGTVALAFASGCSGNDGAISLDASKGALTDKPNDFLFTITVDDARSDGYALDKLTVKATISGKDAAVLVCPVNDVNANKKLDKGDTLACSEGATNTFDAAAVGKDATVELFANIDGKDERVGDATWTPK